MVMPEDAISFDQIVRNTGALLTLVVGLVFLLRRPDYVPFGLEHISLPLFRAFALLGIAGLLLISAGGFWLPLAAQAGWITAPSFSFGWVGIGVFAVSAVGLLGVLAAGWLKGSEE